MAITPVHTYFAGAGRVLVHNATKLCGKAARNADINDRVATPDTNPDAFSRNRSGQYTHKKTGEVWEKSHTNHNADVEWKVGTRRGQPPRAKNKITVGGDGTVIKVDQ